MRKIRAVATVEFLAAVRIKAFIVSVVLMPLLMAGMVGVQNLAEKQVDVEPRRFAVLDHTGELCPALLAKAAERNLAIESGGVRSGPRYEPSLEEPGSRSIEEVRLALSDRVRKEELFAFVEIPAGVLVVGAAEPANILYHSNHPTYQDLRQWIELILNQEIRNRRYLSAGLDRALVDKLEKGTVALQLGLFERAPDGLLRQAEKVDAIKSLAFPGAMMLLMLLLVMSSTPHLLNSVIEEKTGRISEVLLASATPFELMMGKLIGCTGVSLLLALIYMGSGLGFLVYLGQWGAVSLPVLLWSILFLVLGVFLFGSLFIAIGAVCTDSRDAQTFMTPVMVLVLIPAIAFLPVIKAPSSPFAVGLSLFPFSAPFVMLLRVALQPPPPLWQAALSVALAAATVIACVWAAGRILRVGVLLQGKPPSFREMARWVFTR